MSNTNKAEETQLQKLTKYFEQQLNLQRESEIKYTGEEAYFDAVDICKNAIKSLENIDNSQIYTDKKAEELTQEQKLIAFQNMEEIIDAMCLFYAVFKDNDLKTHIHLFPSFDDGKFIWAFETKEYRQSQQDNSSATYNEVIEDLKRENEALEKENKSLENQLEERNMSIQAVEKLGELEIENQELTKELCNIKIKHSHDVVNLVKEIDKVFLELEGYKKHNKQLQEELDKVKKEKEFYKTAAKELFNDLFEHQQFLDGYDDSINKYDGKL